MRYINKTKVEELRNKYEYIIGWGAGGEFRKHYVGRNFLDYIVDSGEKGKQRIGQYINGLKVSDINEIESLSKYSDSTLIVIYPNIEQEILKSIYTVFSDSVDTIVARLLDYGDEVRTYSANKEDILMLEAVEKIGIKNFSYLDIGVCHPVVRNNTYLFYELGNTNGILVEPNVSMCELARIYRPLNMLVNCGASSDEKTSELVYYYDENNPGLNTFSKEIAKKRNMLLNSVKIPVKDINEIIKENFETCPNILDIDTEGMDYEILEGIDFIKFPIDIICAETNGDIKFYDLLGKYGYIVYAETKENTIFIKEGIC